MKGYYTIHDNSDKSNAKLGFVPNVESTKIDVVDGYAPKTKVNDLRWERTFIFEVYKATRLWFDTYWLVYLPGLILTNIIPSLVQTY
jgi:hypothetical protein